MAAVLLVVILVVGILLVPFGLPGLWVMAGGVLVYDLAVPGGGIGLPLVIGTAAAALVGEVLDLALAGRYARKYGGSRRAGWGALLGSLVGAVVGVPLPVVGSVVGAFVGAFAGALLAELTRRTEVRAATRVATGALIGRVVAAGVKVGIGFAVLAVVLFALWRGG
jgi:uncharacterized protein YqgC (DUF456 family)